MTDLLTENARLRAALEAMLHRHILYCGGEGMAFAGHTDVALFQEARAALATPAPDAVQEAARVERVAFAMWKAEADRAAPNVGRNRTPEMFANELHDTRAKWLGLADAALHAIAGDRT